MASTRPGSTAPAALAADIWNPWWTAMPAHTTAAAVKTLRRII
jgi:hypothetical protein